MSAYLRMAVLKIATDLPQDFTWHSAAGGTPGTFGKGTCVSVSTES
jgi:hypothetical protein